MAKSSRLYNKSKILIDLGNTIRELRIKQGLSQESLSLVADLDRSYVGGIERGEHNLTLMNLLKITKALNISASELLKKVKGAIKVRLLY